MYSRFGQFCRRLVQGVMATSPLTVPAYLYFLQNKQHSDRYQLAYSAMESRIKKRSSHALMGSVFDGNHPTKIGGGDVVGNTRTSIEPITHINATYTGAPVIWNKDGLRSELNGLSAEPWPDFLETLSGKIFVTFGFRKAMAATNPVTFTHAVIYVQDTQGNHAFFGFYKHNENDVVGLKDHAMINDAQHHTVLPLYTLHDGLTIEGNKAQTKKLFQTIEHHAKQRFTGWTMNCYTPIVAGLVQAHQLGFKVPDAYRESLLVVVPMERNYGAGITANPMLRPLSNQLVDNILTTENKSRPRF
jgi:hypothetical protein